MALPFAIGFLSHIGLDLLNKKPVQVFFPVKSRRMCLGWCYANRLANKFLLALGVLGAVVGLGAAALP